MTLEAPDVAWVDRFVAMRALPGGQALPAADLALLASIARLRVATVGQKLAEEGREMTSMFVVMNGELTVRRAEREIAHVRAHDLVGALAALARDPRGCDCEAAAAARVLEIRVEDLEDVFEDRREVLLAWIDELSRQSIGLRRSIAASAGYATSAEAGSPPGGPPIELVERIWLLRRNRILRGARVDGLAPIARTARELRLPSGGVLWTSGETASSIVAIVAGTVQATTPERQQFMFGAGDLVGELETMSNAHRWFDAMASEPVIALVLDRDAMLDAWEDHPEIGIEFLRALAVERLALPSSVP